jgi:exopolyphosphatase/guanosine-5'-triphosphate,3'-diphosphate pyrophosphatase
VNAVAAVDCGTNSTRLLVVDGSGSALAREQRITRLGEGVDTSQTLSEPAMERTFAVLREYRSIMSSCGVARAQLVATSAARDASNGSAFLSKAAALTGADVALLTGDEEAELSYRGATQGLASSDLTDMIVDIGGGSTELAARVGDRLVGRSMQIGCVRLSERATGPGIVDDERAKAARVIADEAIGEALVAEPSLANLVGRARLIGLAGTVSTLAQLDAGLASYDRDAVHHRVLTRAVVSKWRATLAGEDPENRLAHPGMVHGREDVLVAGLIVLEAVMDRFGAGELLSSESDILDGIVVGLLGPTNGA